MTVINRNITKHFTERTIEKMIDYCATPVYQTIPKTEVIENKHKWPKWRQEEKEAKRKAERDFHNEQVNGTIFDACSIEGEIL